jgi:hypothetical protein
LPWLDVGLKVLLSSDNVELNSPLPDVWIAVHREHVMKSRRDEAEAATIARRRRREPPGGKSRNRTEAPEMAEELAGVCRARNWGSGAPCAGNMWGFTYPIWEGISIS